MTGSARRISVVIPVFNSEKTIGKCLQSLNSQTHPSYEVIVIDDGSTDNTAQIIQANDSVIFIRQSRGGPSSARNKGIERANGEYVAFTDGDCIVPDDWLMELAKGLENDEVAGSGGDQISPEDESEFGKNIQKYFKIIGFLTGYIKTSDSLGIVDHNPSCNSIYKKSILQDIGGFDPDLWPGEDVDLDYRITQKGYKLTFNPRALVFHYRPNSISGFSRMMLRYGTCQGILTRRYGFFRKIQMVPFIFTFVALSMIGLLYAYPNILPFLTILPVAAWIWFYIRSSDLARSFLYLWLFVITLIYWNWGFLMGVMDKSGLSKP